MRARGVGTVLLAGAAYVLVGTGTATLAGLASSAAAVKGWRLAAWLLSLAVFALHFALERHRRARRLRVAARVALAVAVGALGVAALGPIRTHWGEPSRPKLVVLSLVAWPILTGVPAFVVALLAGLLLDRAGADTKESHSRVA